MKNLNGHRPKSRVGKLMNEKTELRQLYLFNKNRCKEKRKKKKKEKPELKRPIKSPQL